MVKKAKAKKKLGIGLQRWNQVRSFVSSENKRLGSRYKNKDVVRFTKEFLSEFKFRSFSKNDIENFLQSDVRLFYQTPLDLSARQLSEVVYFSIDSKIQSLPKDIRVVVNAAEYGVSSFNTSDYNYQDDCSEIVENIREAVYGLGSDERYPEFGGFIKLNEGADKQSNNPNDYHLELMLFIFGSFVSDFNGMIVPRPEQDIDYVIRTEQEKNRKKAAKKNKKVKVTKSLKQQLKESQTQNVKLEKRISKLEDKLKKLLEDKKSKKK